MSAAGGSGGEASRDEAAWRDLVARFQLPADPARASGPWPAREDLARAADTVADPVAAPDQAGGQQAGPPDLRSWTRPGDGYAPVDRTRVIRPAGDPRSYTPAEDDEERYRPAPLPPPARLDSASKAALVGVIGGPAYLLLSVFFLNWAIAPAAFIAVAAFIGGFVTLIVKLGDRARRDDDDDGAVL